MQIVASANMCWIKRKHSMHLKTAALVLLKLFISGNERCNTTDIP